MEATLYQFFSGEIHDDLTISDRTDEAVMLFSSTGCTKGPFFRLLLIVSLLLSRAPYLPFLRFTINLSLRFFFLRVL